MAHDLPVLITDLFSILEHLDRTPTTDHLTDRMSYATPPCMSQVVLASSSCTFRYNTCISTRIHILCSHVHPLVLLSPRLLITSIFLSPLIPEYLKYVDFTPDHRPAV